MLQNFSFSGVRGRKMQSRVDGKFPGAKKIAMENFLAHGRSRFFFAGRIRIFPSRASPSMGGDTMHDAATSPQDNYDTFFTSSDDK
jgi:hypothetical protein